MSLVDGAVGTTTQKINRFETREATRRGPFVRGAWVVLLALGLSIGCATSDRSAPAPVPAAPPPKPAAAPTPTPPPKPFDPRELTAEISFEEGSDRLSAEAIAELQRFATKLRPYPKRFVHVDGFSEATGVEKSDRWLSERRAKSVASYLVGQRLPISHVTLQGLGSDAPKDSAKAVDADRAVTPAEAPAVTQAASAGATVAPAAETTPPNLRVARVRVR